MGRGRERMAWIARLRVAVVHRRHDLRGIKRQNERSVVRHPVIVVAGYCADGPAVAVAAGIKNALDILRGNRPGVLALNQDSFATAGLASSFLETDCRSSAAFSSGGSSLPRFSALARMPMQPLSLKKYFGGAESSKICDNRDTFSSLGDSPKPRVVKSPSNAPCAIFSVIAPCVGPSSVRYTHMHSGSRLRDFDERFDDRGEVCALWLSARECSGNIFVDSIPRSYILTCPSRISFTLSHLLYDPYCLKEQAAPRGLTIAAPFMLHPGPRTSATEVLTGSAERNDIHQRQFTPAQFGHVSVMLYVATPPSAGHIIEVSSNFLKIKNAAPFGRLSLLYPGFETGVGIRIAPGAETPSAIRKKRKEVDG